MKVYTAGRYSRRDEIAEYARILRANGIEVTSRWLEEKGSLTGNMGDNTDEFYIETANVDIEDVKLADAVIFWAEDPLVGVPRGGRHVEYGYALGTNKPIYVIGPKENVFHYIDRVYHFDTFNEFLNAFRKYADVTE